MTDGILREWKWFYTTDGKDYLGPYDTKREAVEAGRDDYESDEFSVARGLYPLPVDLDVNFIITRPGTSYLTKDKFFLEFAVAEDGIVKSGDNRWIYFNPEDTFNCLDERLVEVLHKIYDNGRAFTKDTVEDIEVIRIS